MSHVTRTRRACVSVTPGGGRGRLAIGGAAASGGPARGAVQPSRLGDRRRPRPSPTCPPGRSGGCSDLPSNLVAHHLRTLREAGLVTQRRSQGDARRTYLQLVARCWEACSSPRRPGPRREWCSSAGRTPPALSSPRRCGGGSRRSPQRRRARTRPRGCIQGPSRCAPAPAGDAPAPHEGPDVGRARHRRCSWPCATRRTRSSPGPRAARFCTGQSPTPSGSAPTTRSTPPTTKSPPASRRAAARLDTENPT